MRKKVPTPTFSEKPRSHSKGTMPGPKVANIGNQCLEKWTGKVTATVEEYRKKLAALYGNELGGQDLQHSAANLTACLAEAGPSTHPCPSHARHSRMPAPACAPPPQLLPPHASPLSAAQAPLRHHHLPPRGQHVAPPLHHRCPEPQPLLRSRL